MSRRPVETATARTWRQLLSEAAAILGSDVDARRIAEEASGRSAAELVAGLDDPVPARQGVALARMVERRAAGEPLQYTLGRWGFRSLDLMVDRRVLIPRPETEQVVEVALAEARRNEARIAADLGTGSGAIALSLATEVPGLQVWGTDASAAALRVAGANLAGLGGMAATRVRLVEGSWFEALPGELRGRLDLVVSNPPYVADGEPLPAEVEDWEPGPALRAGPTGLECLAELVGTAPGWLSPRGVLVCELAPHQAEPARALAAAAGYPSVDIAPDLSGRDRILIARR